MNPSSRTPEGTPHRCPICGESVRIEASTYPTRDAPCPHCGHLLWFNHLAGDAIVSGLKREYADVHTLAASPELLAAARVHKEQPFDTGDRVTWVLMTAVSTLIVCVNDGLILTTALWFLGIVAFGQFILPLVFRRTHDLELLDENFYLGVIMGWGLAPGPLVGVLFGVLLPWVYDCGLSSFEGGLIGLVAGPCFTIIEGLIIASIVDVITWVVSGTRLSKLSM